MIRRKQIKQMAGCVMAVTMALAGVSLSAGTENINVEVVYANETLTYTEGNSIYTYTELSDGTLEISDYEGTDTEIVIPGEIDGKKVTSIGYWAFNYCWELTSIGIPEGVTSIGDYAFYDCSSLERIEIPDRVTSIGNVAFSGCRSLEEIEVSEENIYYKSVDGVLFNKKMTEIICYPSDKKDTVYIVPEGVTSIGNYAFSRCSSLERIEIPDSVTSIGQSAFEVCSSLTSVVIPSGVMDIYGYAFSGCSSLTSIEISSSVRAIGQSAFEGCSSLEEIEVSEENIYYKSVEGVLFNKEMTVIICYPSGKKYTVYVVPSGVTSIYDSAFEGCSSLEEITIPSSATIIAYNAFSGCSSLTSIEIPSSVTNIGAYAFSGCSSLTSIEIPSGVTSIGWYAFSGCSSLASIEIPSSVTNIGDGAFEGCSNLTSIEIPEGVMSIGYGAFEGCSSLTSVGIPLGVTNIYGSTFSGCSSLTSVEMEEGITNIGYDAFSDCSSLIRIEIPDSVTYIDYSAFSNCSNLTIYGKKDSYAETYAKENDIPFIAIDKITSLDNITVTYPSESIQGTVSLETRKLTEADEEYNKINFEDKIIDSSVAVEDVAFTAYDISLVDENNNKVQPSQLVTVKILCPEGYDGEKCNIYRVNDDGTFTDMKAEYERGYLVFKTNHFSVYLITETELLTTPDIISGDVNGDGTLDIKDSALLKRYLAGWEVEIDEEAADVDGDGKVTIKDSALVKRYLAGWDVEFVAD